ncbi:MAG TPA: BPSL0067 family protein [Rickettsiales bacterium]|nr:BPSL0067 family protein [Rickettsiales bacterium]
MQLRSNHKLTATPKGILFDDKPLNKSVQQELSPYALRYIKRAGELLKQVSPEDWDKHTPHHMNDVPELARAQMMLALANPIILNKYSADQPRDWHGRWTDGSADTSTPTYQIDHSEEYQVASSGTVMTDAQVDSDIPKAHILDNPAQYVHQSFPNAKGNTECVAFAQQVGGAPLTSEWVAGDYISPDNPPPKGTWVATFNRDGNYQGHVGAFSRFDNKGNLYLYDQFNKKGKVTEQFYRHKPKDWKGHISNNPTQYRIVKW